MLPDRVTMYSLIYIQVKMLQICIKFSLLSAATVYHDRQNSQICHFH